MADRVLTVKVQGDTTGLGHSFNKASKESQQFGQSMHHHVVGGLHAVGKAASYAGGLIGIGFAGAVVDAIKVAADAQVSQKRLATSLNHAGISWRKQGQAIEETQKNFASMSGFTLPDLENSLSKLGTTTGSLTDSYHLQNEAMNLARAKSISLQQASVILSKVWNGNTTSLTRLGISIPKVTTAYDELMAKQGTATIEQKKAAKAADLVSSRNAALGALTKKFGGQWHAYANTASGALARIRASADILLMRLGNVLLPYLNRFATWFTQHLPEIQRDATKAFADLRLAISDVVAVIGPLVGWFNKNRDVALALAAAVGVLVAGIEIYAGAKALQAALTATGELSKAQLALNLVMDANPIGIAIIAAAALAAGFIILYNRSTTFRTVVQHVMHDVQVAFGAVTNFIHQHWGSVMGFVESAARHIWQVIGPIIGFIHDHWKTLLAFITGGMSVAVQFIVNHWGTIKSAVSRVVGFVIHRWGNIKSAISAFAGWVNHYIIGPINYIIKKAKEAIGWLEKLNPFGGNGPTGPIGGGSGRGAGSHGGSPAQNQALAASMLGSYGFAGSQMSPLTSLWNQESGWSQFAYNASSGATGIPQSLPYSKMPRAAWLPSQGGQASPSAQIGWGLGYIKGRYGSPSGAWAHEQAYNWYDKGGIVPGPRGVHRPAMVAGGETILPTHKGGGWGTTINVYMPAGLVVGSKQEISRVVREAVVTGLRTNGPNAFVPTVGARI